MMFSAVGVADREVKLYPNVTTSPILKTGNALVVTGVSMVMPPAGNRASYDVCLGLEYVLVLDPDCLAVVLVLVLECVWLELGFPVFDVEPSLEGASVCEVESPVAVGLGSDF